METIEKKVERLENLVKELIDELEGLKTHVHANREHGTWYWHYGGLLKDGAWDKGRWV